MAFKYIFVLAFSNGQLATYLFFPLQNYLPKLPPIHQLLPIPTTVIPKEETNSIVDELQPVVKNVPFMKFVNSPRFVTEQVDSFFNDITTSTKPSPTKSRTTFRTASNTNAIERFTESIEQKERLVTVSTELIREGVFKNRSEIVYPDENQEVPVVPSFLSAPVSTNSLKYPTVLVPANRPIATNVDRPFVLPDDNVARQQIQEAIKTGELGARNYLKAIPRVRYTDSSTDIVSN